MRTALKIVRTIAICLVILNLLCCSPGLGKITMKAEVNFPDMGGRRPVAKETVYLLSNSITSPEMEEAFRQYMARTTPQVSAGRSLQDKEVGTRAGFMRSNGKAIWHRYIVDSVETDFQGRATFRKLKAGDYWIYCSRPRPAGQWLLWNVKTTVKFYENTDVTLNNQNLLN